MNPYKNKNVLILGLGSYPQGSGISALKFLYEKGAKLIVSDMKQKSLLKVQLGRLKKYRNIRYIFGTHDLSLKGIDMIVKNPGVPAAHPLLKEAASLKIPIESDITLFMKEAQNPIIGITGTRGKSTTSSLVHAIIRKKYPSAQLGGNIKISPLNFLGRLKPGVPIVLELSSWQLNAMKNVRRSPQIAVVTNVMVDHLNMYPSFGAYVADKKLVFKFQRATDFLIINKDNALTYHMGGETKSQVFYFSLKPLTPKESGAFLSKSGDIIFQDGLIRQKLFNRSELLLPGTHNVSNVMAAAIAARAAGIPTAQIKAAAAKFKGIDSRLELIRTLDKVKIYNDTTATTPDATIAALRSFDRKIILIAGGTDKKLLFKEAGTEINKSAKRLILLPGTATEKLRKFLNPKRMSAPKGRDLASGGEILEARSMKEAVTMAWAKARPDDIIVLSPGAASFGLFRNEFDRGEQFVKEVKKLKPHVEKNI